MRDKRILQIIDQWYPCEVCHGRFFMGAHFCTGPKKGSNTWELPEQTSE